MVIIKTLLMKFFKSIFILLTTLLITLSSFNIKGQTTQTSQSNTDFKSDQVYEVITKFTVFGYNGSTVTTDTFVMCKGATIKILNKLATDPNKMAVSILSIAGSPDCAAIGAVATPVIEERDYVIESQYWVNLKASKTHVTLDVGVLPLLFKFDPRSYKVYTAGQAGGYLGPKINFKNKFTLTIPAVSFGIGAVPINDTTSTSTQDTRTALGAYFAVGLLGKIGSNVSIAILGGVDFVLS